MSEKGLFKKLLFILFSINSLMYISTKISNNVYTLDTS